MSNKERDIIILYNQNRDWTHGRICRVVGCTREHVSKTIARYARGLFPKISSTPPHNSVELVLNHIPSDINNDLCKIRRLAA